MTRQKTRFFHLSLLKSELNRAISLLCKIRHYIPKFLLKTLYYTIFHSHLIYACQIQGQSFNTLMKINHYKIKHHELSILKPTTRFQRPLQNVKPFICKRCTNKVDDSLFPKLLYKSENLHQHNTRHAKQNSVIFQIPGHTNSKKN